MIRVEAIQVRRGTDTVEIARRLLLVLYYLHSSVTGSALSWFNDQWEVRVAEMSDVRDVPDSPRVQSQIRWKIDKREGLVVGHDLPGEVAGGGGGPEDETDKDGDEGEEDDGETQAPYNPCKTKALDVVRVQQSRRNNSMQREGEVEVRDTDESDECEDARRQEEEEEAACDKAAGEDVQHCYAIGGEEESSDAALEDEGAKEEETRELNHSLEKIERSVSSFLCLAAGCLTPRGEEAC